MRSCFVLRQHRALRRECLPSGVHNVVPLSDAASGESSIGRWICTRLRSRHRSRRTCHPALQCRCRMAQLLQAAVAQVQLGQWWVSRDCVRSRARCACQRFRRCPSACAGVYRAGVHCAPAGSCESRITTAPIPVQQGLPPGPMKSWKCPASPEC